MQYIVPWHQKIYRWACNFLLVQLFINLITWPLFLSWGLPITPLSIIGNLVFSPFLTAFLMVSSLLVTCDLMMIPSGIFAWALELTTNVWLWLTACPTPHCMITFVTPPLVLALCAPLGATYVVMSKHFKTTGQKVAALVGLYGVLMILFMLNTKPAQIEVPYGSHTITVINKEGKLTLIDTGFSRRSSGINQWINYTLLPALGYSFGRQTVDHVIVKRKTPTAHACAQELRIRGISNHITFETNSENARVSTIEDAPAKTTPSSHASPSRRSKNPWYQNRPYPQSKEYRGANS